MAADTAFRVACVQTSSQDDVAANTAAAAALILDAHKDGAQLIVTPENVAFMGSRAQLQAQAVAAEEHPALAAFREVAAATGVWLLVGSLAVRGAEGKMVNRSFLVDGGGEVVATYDKIHLFDVDLADGERYRESADYDPGGQACLAATPWGALGMTVCYDMRFPHLYRALAQAGARYLSVPSAFTVPTGRAHWHVLLRARAIESGCFVFAPAQCGTHPKGRKTFGHSLIVAPWGEILADGGEKAGFICAEIDPARGDEARAMVPSLKHDRPYAAPGATAQIR